VEFEPFRPPHALHEALATQASVGLVTLEDTFYNRNLTCPVKALDYLAHGLPVIGTDLPSVREILGGAGQFVPPGGAQEIAAAAAGLLADAQSYHDAAAAAHRRAADLAWPRRAARLIEFAESAP
jgi:glycosyltransferase involved in cell wall biosynthesis